jgi:hypothetical protein
MNPDNQLQQRGCRWCQEIKVHDLVCRRVSGRNRSLGIRVPVLPTERTAANKELTDAIVDKAMTKVRSNQSQAEPEGEVPPDVVYVGKWQTSATHFDWVPSLRRAQPEDIQYRRVETCVWVRIPNGFATGCDKTLSGAVMTNASMPWCGFCGGKLSVE